MNPVIFTDDLLGACSVIDELKRRGRPPTVISPSRLADLSFTLTLEEGAVGSTILVGTPSQSFEISPDSRIWRWKCGWPGADDLIDPDPVISEIKRSQYRVTLRAIWEAPAHWMNPYTADWRLDQSKLLGSSIARECGFEVPNSLLSDDPVSFKDFIEREGAEYFAIKPSASWAAKRPDGTAIASYARRLSAKDALGYSASVRHAPVLVQPYVQKAYEVRLTCVGEKTFAARIDSQSSDQTSVDWRHYPATPVAHDPWDIPADIETIVRRFMGKSGLAYAAIDLIVTPAGKVVFLEANPAGQYLWIEELTGLPISAAIADWLTEG